MKKVVLAFVLVLGALSFNSCTDNKLNDLEERNEFEIKATEKDDNVNSSGSGQGEDDTNEEE